MDVTVFTLGEQEGWSVFGRSQGSSVVLRGVDNDTDHVTLTLL